MPKRKRAADVVEAIKPSALSGYGLTWKQERFVREYATSGNATQSYKRAYDCARMADKSIETEGLRLLKHPGITLALDRHRRDMAAETTLSFAGHMAELARLRDIAKEAGRYVAAVRAEYLRGRLCGFYSDKAEINAKDEYANMTDAELRAAILAQSDALRALGIDPVDLTELPAPLKAISGPRRR